MSLIPLVQISRATSVYRRAYHSVSKAHGSLGSYLAFYNQRRRHSSLGVKTPDQVYFNPPTPIPAAA